MPHVSSLFQDTCSFPYFSKVESLSKSYGGLAPLLSTAADFWRPPVCSFLVPVQQVRWLSRQPSKHRVFVRKYPAYFLFQGWPQNSDLPFHFTDCVFNQSIRSVASRQRLFRHWLDGGFLGRCFFQCHDGVLSIRLKHYLAVAQVLQERCCKLHSIRCNPFWVHKSCCNHLCPLILHHKDGPQPLIVLVTAGHECIVKCNSWYQVLLSLLTGSRLVSLPQTASCDAMPAPVSIDHVPCGFMLIHFCLSRSIWRFHQLCPLRLLHFFHHFLNCILGRVGPCLWCLRSCIQLLFNGFCGVRCNLPLSTFRFEIEIVHTSFLIHWQPSLSLSCCRSVDDSLDCSTSLRIHGDQLSTILIKHSYPAKSQALGCWHQGLMHICNGPSDAASHTAFPEPFKGSCALTRHQLARCCLENHITRTGDSDLVVHPTFWDCRLRGSCIQVESHPFLYGWSSRWCANLSIYCSYIIKQSYISVRRGLSTRFRWLPIF